MLEKCINFKASPTAIAQVAENLELDIIAKNNTKAFELLESKGALFDAQRIFNCYPLHRLLRPEANGHDLLLEMLGRLSKTDRIALLNGNMMTILAI